MTSHYDACKQFEKWVKTHQEQRNNQSLEAWQAHYEQHIQTLMPIINFLSYIRSQNYWVFNAKNFHYNTWRYKHKSIPFDFYVHHLQNNPHIPIIQIPDPIPLTIQLDFHDETSLVFKVLQPDNECPIKSLIKQEYTEIDSLLNDLACFLAYYVETKENSTTSTLTALPKGQMAS